MDVTALDHDSERSIYRMAGTRHWPQWPPCRFLYEDPAKGRAPKKCLDSRLAKSSSGVSGAIGI